MSTEEVDVNAEYSDPKDIKMPKMIPDARRYCSKIYGIQLTTNSFSTL